MNNEAMTITTKKNGKTLPKIEPQVTEAMAPRKLSDDKAATVRLLNERIRSSREQLGALDFDRARLEGQAAQVRAKLAQDMTEADALISQGAKDAGVNLQEPGWRLDMATGEFTRSA
jgi:hypothetical protein